MLPAEQCFEADDLERIEVDHRLVGEAELLFHDRLSQLRDPLETVESRLIQVVVVEGVVHVPVKLRAVHRSVRLLEELGAAAAESDTHARRE